MTNFNTIEGLTWLPWYPNDFNGLFILGESNYGGWDNDEWLKSPDFVKNRILGPALNGDPKEPLYRNLERAIFGSSQITEAQRSSFWNQIGFMNLVQRPMASIKERPTRHDYANGWEVVWPTLKLANCRKLLIIGTESAKIQTFRQMATQKGLVLSNEVWSEQKNGSSHEISIDLNDSPLERVLFIKHASQFFSWETCHKFLVNQKFDWQSN